MRSQQVPVFQAVYFRPFEVRSVGVLIVVHKVCGRFYFRPAIIRIAGTGHLLNVITITGFFAELEREDHFFILFVFIFEEVGIFACPQAITARFHFFEIVARFLVLFLPHIYHTTQGISGSFRGTAVVFIQRVMGEVGIVDAIRQIIQNDLPYLIYRRLTTGTVFVIDGFQINGDSLIKHIQTIVCPGTEETGFALVTRQFISAHIRFMQIGNRIVTRMDDGVTELPFIPHLKVIGRFGGQRKQFHRIVVGIIIGCKAHSFDSLTVQSVGTTKLGGGELGGIEREVESCHSLVGKLLRGPHVFTCYLVFRSHIENIHAGGSRQRHR